MLVFCSLFFWPGGAIFEGPHVVSWMVVEESDLVVWRTNERSTHGKKIPKKSCRPLQGSGQLQERWCFSEGVFGAVREIF